VEAAVAVYFPDRRMPTDKQPWNRLPQHLDSVLIQDSEWQGGAVQLQTRTVLAMQLGIRFVVLVVRGGARSGVASWAGHR
jgi:hypothetical protein